ncbi:uncharacterized protein LOC119567475 isoform X1 [Chelonia mydas]|uniref:uncharacterized protein LOC119567475 isoform X1 n=1 Tax=Chelonia mydas TaxID=8469 RepID=UPI001CA8FD7F|nr:uncharacterized protein LOC119567475 isoform X1 [Chelonia mydas]
MIGMLLLWAFTDASAALSVISLQNPVRVFSGQTAVLPVSLQFQNPAWEFYHVKWDFITGKRPVLVYMVDSCTGAPGSRERTCQHSLEQTGLYQQRANISFENASLVLKAVQPEDAGMYRVTVRSLDVSGTALVNLTVEGNRGEASPTVTEGIRGEVSPLVTGGNRREMSPLGTDSNIGEASPLVTEDDRGEATSLVIEGNRDEATPLVMGGNRREATTLATDHNRGEASPLVTRSDRGKATPLVTGGEVAWKSLSTINSLRMVFACLVLCILALTVGEYIYASGSNFTQREETLGPPEMPDGGAPLVGATQHITVVPSTSASFHGQ